ncbi:unnamed protein product, partial [Meganyctiphanes norvegica]
KYEAPAPKYEAPAPKYEAPAPKYEAPKPSYHAPAHKYEEKHEEGMPFDFAYNVVDDYKDLNFGHNSNSDGDVVTGEYRVLLPDGRTQIVTYTADHYSGYKAEVTYEGEAKPYHPTQTKYEAPKPSYKAPSPTYGAPSH